MSPALKRLLVVALLFLSSAYCLLAVLATAKLSAYSDTMASARACAWLAGCILLGATGIWQLVVLLRRHGRENLL
jgi:hypothetical protein